MDLSIQVPEYRSCIEACYECAAACDHCSVACLSEHDVHMMARCIRLDMDCAAMCRVAAACMTRASEMAAEICMACARVCEACAEECGKHTHEHCQQCAEACRRCADECHRMSRAARPQAATARV